MHLLIKLVGSVLALLTRFDLLLSFIYAQREIIEELLENQVVRVGTRDPLDTFLDACDSLRDLFVGATHLCQLCRYL